MDREFVDLGLSVKWATMNIGADKIIEPGGYFAWGETKAFFFRLPGIIVPMR